MPSSSNKVLSLSKSNPCQTVEQGQGPEKLRPGSVGFDFDGVIADIGEAFIRLACEEYDYCSIQLDDIKSFQVEHCTDIPRDIVESIFDEILEDSLGTGLKPIQGALETLSRLQHHGDVMVITARPLKRPVEDWFDYHCPDRAGAIGSIRVVVTGDHDNKERYIRQCGLHHFIDDRTLTCQQLLHAGLSPIVFTQPWNRDQHDLPAVADWTEIANLFDLG
jgi:5'(3')-deoxyribonucleotidase